MSKNPIKTLYNYPPKVIEKVKSLDEYKDKVPTTKNMVLAKTTVAITIVIIVSLILRYINGYKFGLNNQSLGLILDDKYATYELLNSFNINVCKHHILFKSSNKDYYAKEFNSFQYCYNFQKD